MNSRVKELLAEVSKEIEETHVEIALAQSDFEKRSKAALARLGSLSATLSALSAAVDAIAEDDQCRARART